MKGVTKAKGRGRKTGQDAKGKTTEGQGQTVDRKHMARGERRKGGDKRQAARGKKYRMMVMIGGTISSVTFMSGVTQTKSKLLIQGNVMITKLRKESVRDIASQPTQHVDRGETEISIGTQNENRRWK